MSSASDVQGRIEAPPRLETGPLGWLRANLFNSWLNSVLTLLILWLVVVTVVDLAQWLFINAVWRGTPADCEAPGAGACWAMLDVWGRFILFGRFPFEEQWRPLVAVALFVVMIALSCFKQLWGRGLLLAWLATFAAFAILMWGGVFGLAPTQDEFWGGLPLTLIIAVVSLIAAFPLGILLALGRRSSLPIFRGISVAYIEPVRGVPLISVLFMASVMFPLFLPPDVSIDKLLRTIVGFTLFEAAYVAEVVRAGLQAIPRGQYEAADAMGLSYWQKTRLIILPQALRLVIPPMVGSFISAFKDTSLVLIVGLYDLLNTAKTALVDPTWRAYYREAYIFVAVIYFAFCYTMSRYSQWIERDLARGQNRGGRR